LNWQPQQLLQTGNANEQKFPGDLQQLIEATAPAIRATDETEHQQTYDFSAAYSHFPNKDVLLSVENSAYGGIY
jgi:hypothetical protein